ncbi:hypothetical protein BB561_003202 [Smittium simulii]|uniref:NUDE domain-containing protein n=1 Tax=Smittium simulii TaxID=133385 RepID=A0A2T9YMJ5_9FUNG|nr:hypothetical protein BB561_003202 [Smittium simulii]
MEENDFEDPTTFQTKEEELEYWKTATYNARDLYIDAQIEIESVQKQIVDLSVEFENDINVLEKANSGLRSEIERLKASVEDWREKYKKERQNSEQNYTKTERELQFVKSQQEFYKSRTRELEQDNDDLEKAERAIKSSLLDAETKMKRLSQTNESLLFEVKSKNQLVEEQKLTVPKDQNQFGNLYSRSMNVSSNDKSWNEVIERMKGLESRIENARSLVSPLIHQNKKQPISNKTEITDKIHNLNSPASNRSFRPEIIKSASICVSSERTSNPGLREPTQLGASFIKPPSIGRANFMASSESSRLRMEKSRALRNEMRKQASSNQPPNDQQKVPS